MEAYNFCDHRSRRAGLFLLISSVPICRRQTVTYNLQLTEHISMALQLTSATAQLIQKLLEGPNLLDRFGSEVMSPIDLISAIESAKEMAAVPYLVLYILNANGKPQERAVKAVEFLAGEPRGIDLLRLDQSLRYQNYYGPSAKLPNWTTIKPSYLDALNGLPISSCTIIGLLSFHASGYVREAAVRRLAVLTTGDELKYLLIRLNDWVPAVRIAARQAVQARMRPAYARIFAANIGLIERLTHWERVNHAQFINWVLEYLRAPECQADVVALLQSPDAITRRLIYRLLATPGSNQITSLLRQGFEDRDPTIRLWAIREARKHLSWGTLAEMLAVPLKDKSAAVRLQAARAYVEHLDAESAPLLKRFLMDSAASLRSIGRYYLARMEHCDFPAFYRSQLGGSAVKQVSTAIAGLSEVGGATDADLLLPFIQHANAKIATAAVRGLVRLDPERFTSEIMGCLLKGTPSVSREAAKALSLFTHLLDKDLLWTEFQRNPTSITRKRIIQVLFSSPKWESLYYLLSTYANEDATIARLAKEGLQRWLHQFNRGFSRPTKEQLERLLEVIETVSTTLSSSTIQKIMFFMGTPTK
jgi:HEAT repeat protein